MVTRSQFDWILFSFGERKRPPVARIPSWRKCQFNRTMDNLQSVQWILVSFGERKRPPATRFLNYTSANSRTTLSTHPTCCSQFNCILIPQANHKNEGIAIGFGIGIGISFLIGIISIYCNQQSVGRSVSVSQLYFTSNQLQTGFAFGIGAAVSGSEQNENDLQIFGQLSTLMNQMTFLPQLLHQSMLTLHSNSLM